MDFDGFKKAIGSDLKESKANARKGYARKRGFYAFGLAMAFKPGLWASVSICGFATYAWSEKQAF